MVLPFFPRCSKVPFVQIKKPAVRCQLCKISSKKCWVMTNEVSKKQVEVHVVVVSLVQPVDSVASVSCGVYNLQIADWQW